MSKEEAIKFAQRINSKLSCIDGPLSEEETGGLRRYIEVCACAIIKELKDATHTEN